MERKDVLTSPDYWITLFQTNLYNCAMQYMEEMGLNRTQLAEHLGVSKGYVSQLLNGNFDHRLSKFVELSLAFKRIPKLEFVKMDEYIQTETINGKLIESDYTDIRYQANNEFETKNLNWDTSMSSSRKLAKEVA